MATRIGCVHAWRRACVHAATYHTIDDTYGTVANADVVVDLIVDLRVMALDRPSVRHAPCSFGLSANNNFPSK